jgi:hypothetical protein
MLGLANTIQKTAGGYPQYRTRNSVTLNADNEYIAVAGHADWQVNGEDFSVSGWIKFTADATSVSNEDGVVIFDGTDEDSPVNGFYIKYKDDANDDEKIQVKHFHASSSPVLNGSTNIAHNTWYNVVYTYKNSTTTGTLYLNGAVDGTDTSFNTPDDVNTDDEIEIATSSSDEADTIVCEVVFWKGITLSAAQVVGIYNNGRPKNGLSCERSYIKGYWKLNADDATGSSNVVDSSGNSHHGTAGSAVADGDFDTTDVPV